MCNCTRAVSGPEPFHRLPAPPFPDPARARQTQSSGRPQVRPSTPYPSTARVSFGPCFHRRRHVSALAFALHRRRHGRRDRPHPLGSRRRRAAGDGPVFSWTFHCPSKGRPPSFHRLFTALSLPQSARLARLASPPRRKVYSPPRPEDRSAMVGEHLSRRHSSHRHSSCP